MLTGSIHFETELLPQAQNALIGYLKALLAALGGAVDHLQKIVAFRHVETLAQNGANLSMTIVVSSICEAAHLA